MYGLARSVSLDFLRELELQQVCLGEFQAILQFDRDTCLIIEGTSEISSKEDNVSRLVHADRPDETKELVRFLGSRIVDAVNLGDGSIRLHFSNGALITLFDSNKDLESYQISSAGNEGIVV